MLRGEERFFAMEDGRVRALGIVVTVQLTGPQVEPDAALQRGMGIGLEVRVDQVGELARTAVEFNDVRSLDLPKVRAGATLVDSQQRFEGIERTAVDVKVVRAEFAH